MSGTRTVARARPSFIVEWEEPEIGPLEEDRDAASSRSLLVAVTTAAVRAATLADRDGDAPRVEAERLGQAWMQGEPSS